MTDRCRLCSVVLNAENWFPSYRLAKNRMCTRCHVKVQQNYRKNKNGKTETVKYSPKKYVNIEYPETLLLRKYDWFNRHKRENHLSLAEESYFISKSEYEEYMSDYQRDAEEHLTNYKPIHF